MNIESARKNLQSDNPENVIAGLKSLGSNGSLQDLQSVMALVKSPNSSIKKAASDITCQLIRENLIVHFSELENLVKEKLCVILQSLDPSVVDEISKDLFSENEERRLRAVQVLGLLRKNPRIKDILAKLIQDRDVKVRATAVNLLGKTIGPNDHDVILSLLTDSDKRVRANTIEALESLGNKRVVPLLLRFRRDSNNRIRGNVLKALYKLGFTEIETDLLEMLEGGDNFMIASSLWVISQIKINTKKIEDAAGFCLLSDNEMVLSNATKALSALDSPRSRGYLKHLNGVFASKSTNSVPI
jgi:HEAT repeat protein